MTNMKLEPQDMVVLNEDRERHALQEARLIWGLRGGVQAFKFGVTEE